MNCTLSSASPFFSRPIKGADSCRGNLRSSFCGAHVVFDKSLLRKNIKSNGGSFSVVASVLGRRVKGGRETVIPDPDYRIPIVLLGAAGGLAYTDNLLAAVPAGLLGLLLLVQAVRILVPPARFEASKLKVVFTREVNKSAGIIPRTYILSHCDFTANLTLTISDVINLDQLRGWYNKDDVVAEWKKVKDEMCLHVHCNVSGPNSLLDLTAEFRYNIFSKELPLVLESVLYGDSNLFRENPELLDALVRVYFHSTSQKYNRLEWWGPLKDAVLGRHHHMQGVLRGGKDVSTPKKHFYQRVQEIYKSVKGHTSPPVSHNPASNSLTPLDGDPSPFNRPRHIYLTNSTPMLLTKNKAMRAYVQSGQYHINVEG